MHPLLTRLVPVLIIAAMMHEAAAQTDTAPSTVTVPHLTVEGHADLRKPADQLRLTIGVVTENPEATVALKENTSKVEAVLKAIDRVGLKKGDYQTGRFQLQPMRSPRPRQVSPDWEPKIIGYRVTNAIDVRTTQLDLTGKLIQAANEAGANSIENIRFDLADQRTHRTEAIAVATRNALADAETLASAAGVRLVRLLSVNLDNASVRPPGPPRGGARMMAAAESAPVPITSGDVTVRATVAVVYEIAPSQ